MSQSQQDIAHLPINPPPHEKSDRIAPKSHIISQPQGPEGVPHDVWRGRRGAPAQAAQPRRCSRLIGANARRVGLSVGTKVVGGTTFWCVRSSCKSGGVLHKVLAVRLRYCSTEGYASTSNYLVDIQTSNQRFGREYLVIQT